MYWWQWVLTSMNLSFLPCVAAAGSTEDAVTKVGFVAEAEAEEEAEFPIELCPVRIDCRFRRYSGCTSILADFHQHI